MNGKKSTSLFLLVMISIFFTAAVAAGANGKIKVNFRYVDPATGTEQSLPYGFIYLHDASKPAPMEKFFSKADYIIGPANNAAGTSVPEGTYYIRLLQRKVISGPLKPYGPPVAGDLTWFQTTPITVTANQTLDLGTRYAAPFGSAPITITGVVRTSSGTPLPGRFVRAQVTPCLTEGWENNINQCGPVKLPALNPTDANGRYTLELREPGTYYIYTYSSFDTNPGCSGYCNPPITGTPYPTYMAVPQPITIQAGETRTADIVAY